MHGGLSIDKTAATAKGLITATRTALRNVNRPVNTALIQAFGAVGAPMALFLHQSEIAKILAVNNILGTIVDTTGNGLDVAELHKTWMIGGDTSVMNWAKEHPEKCLWKNDVNAIWLLHADILVPAARTEVLACMDELSAARRENPDCESAEFCAAVMSPSIVVEGANHPLTPSAELFLERKGVAILVDHVVNAGGLIHCFFEWTFRDSILDGELSVDEVRLLAERYTEQVVAQNTATMMFSRTSKREAANEIATVNGREVKRLLEEIKSSDGHKDLIKAYFEHSLAGSALVMTPIQKLR